MADPRPPAPALLRRRQVVGILILAGAILLFTILRADGHALFPAGWWRW